MPGAHRDTLCFFCSTPCGEPVFTIQVRDQVNNIWMRQPICTICCEKAGITEEDTYDGRRDR